MDVVQLHIEVCGGGKGRWRVSDTPALSSPLFYVFTFKKDLDIKLGGGEGQTAHLEDLRVLRLLRRGDGDFSRNTRRGCGLAL